MVVGTEARVVAGKEALTPEGTAVTSVLVAVNFDVVCSDTGQSTNPVERHPTPTYVILVLKVVVVRSARGATLAVVGADAVVVGCVFLSAHTSAIVV